MYQKSNKNDEFCNVQTLRVVIKCIQNTMRRVFIMEKYVSPVIEILIINDRGLLCAVSGKTDNDVEDDFVF